MNLKPMKLSRLIAPILLFWITGCAPKYIPCVINAPMLKNKGEVQISVNGGTSKFSPHIAYAVTDNIGIMLNGSFANQDSIENSDLYKVRYGELAAGYFKPFGNSGLFDIYAGYGYGTINSTFTGWSIEAWNTESEFVNNRFFLQPSIGYTNKYVDLNFATEFNLTAINKNNVSKNSFFISPVVTSKFGYDYIKLIFQLGASIKTGQESANFDYNPFVVNLGLQIDLFRNQE